MNERIRELAEQATKKYDRLGNEIPFAQPDLEKFAELIVKECVSICEDHPAWTGRMIGNQIKEHFGVDGMSTEDKKTLIKELLGVKNVQ